MHSGRYVFSQVVDFVPRYEFDRIVAKYNGNYHARDLNCYNQFLHLLFGQLTGCSSLRETCLCLEAHKGILYHLGFRNTVDSTSLSRANERRDYRIYEEFGYLLIGIVRPLYYYNKVHDMPLANDMLALDSTTISVSIRLCAWALGMYSMGSREDAHIDGPSRQHPRLHPCDRRAMPRSQPARLDRPRPFHLLRLGQGLCRLCLVRTVRLGRSLLRDKGEGQHALRGGGAELQHRRVIRFARRLHRQADGGENR